MTFVSIKYSGCWLGVFGSVKLAVLPHIGHGRQQLCEAAFGRLEQHLLQDQTARNRGPKPAAKPGTDNGFEGREGQFGDPGSVLAAHAP